MIISRLCGGVRTGIIALNSKRRRALSGAEITMDKRVLVINPGSTSTKLALFCGTGFSRVFLVTMAMAVASMSEFLPALAYSMIAISVRDCGESIGDGKKSAAKAAQKTV